MKSLADAMNVTPGTATAMAKHLHERGLVAYTPRQGTSLTEAGRSLAVRMVRRHRLIETFLERILEYDWSEVHSDAEELEHVVSEQFVERIDRILGYPETDPHGDPIPRANGDFALREVLPLPDLAPGEEREVARLVDDSESFLEFMKEHAIMPGRRVRLVSANPAAGTVLVHTETNQEAVAVSVLVAARVLVLGARS